MLKINLRCLHTLTAGRGGPHHHRAGYFFGDGARPDSWTATARAAAALPADARRSMGRGGSLPTRWTIRTKQGVGLLRPKIIMLSTCTWALKAATGRGGFATQRPLIRGWVRGVESRITTQGGSNCSACASRERTATANGGRTRLRSGVHSNGNDAGAAGTGRTRSTPKGMKRVCGPRGTLQEQGVGREPEQGVMRMRLACNQRVMLKV